MLLWTKNRINEFKTCCEMQEPKSDILHALDLAALLEEALEHIVSLQVEVERLREGEECHVARPGEGTYECNINKPCPACRLRYSEEKIKKSYEQGVKDFIDWYKDKFPKCNCEELEFRSKSFLIEKNPEEWLENWISFFEFEAKRKMILNSLEIKIKEAKDEGDPIPTKDTITLLEATLKLFSPNIKKDNLIGLFLTDSGAINFVLQNAEERTEFMINSPNIILKFV